MIDSSTGGRGKGAGPSDNQSTASSFFLVYKPNSRPAAMRQQIGFFRASGDVETASHPGANASQPAGGDRDPELHGAARRAGPVRDAVSESRPGSTSLLRRASRRSARSSRARTIGGGCGFANRSSATLVGQ